VVFLLIAIDYARHRLQLHGGLRSNLVDLLTNECGCG
jgi:hypothetical protein